MSNLPNTADAHQFPTKAFNDEELTTLCFEYFPQVVGTSVHRYAQSQKTEPA